MFKKVFVIAIVTLTVSLVWAQIRTSDTTITEALAKRASERAFQAQATSVGLNCDIMFPEDICKNMISRAEKNPRLRDALLYTQAKSVYVYPEIWP